MATTQLFVKLLITGTGVIIWVALLIAGIVEHQFSLSDLKSISDGWYLLAVIAYVFGILLDRIVYSLFKRKEKGN